MSIIRAIKHRLGLSVTPANNFVWDASADNGTCKLARESGQDIMTVDAAGKVGFSVGILGFVYTNQSAQDKFAITLPSWLGGWSIQWGLSSISVAAPTVTLPVAHTGTIVSVANHFTNIVPAGFVHMSAPPNNSSFTAYIINPSTGTGISGNIYWIVLSK